MHYDSCGSTAARSGRSPARKKAAKRTAGHRRQSPSGVLLETGHEARDNDGAPSAALRPLAALARLSATRLCVDDARADIVHDSNNVLYLWDDGRRSERGTVEEWIDILDLNIHTYICT